MGCACSKFSEAVPDHDPFPSSFKPNESRQSSARYSSASAKSSNLSQQPSLVIVKGLIPASAQQQLQDKERRKTQIQELQVQQQRFIKHGTISKNHEVPPSDLEVRRLSSNQKRLENLWSLPRRHSEGEQVAAGWPPWLSAVAGEAIQGWIPRRADSFEKLEKIGQGTYSNVYKARDLESRKTVALKKVRVDTMDAESVRFMAREIHVLRRLDHPNVIKLEGLVTSRTSCSLYLVFEYMEHDLAGLIASPGVRFTEPQVKCYVRQLLLGLEHCHERGVLHRDIKGSNLLLDNSGVLKIADFGLATFFRADQNQSLTSKVVTLWYRPPELLLGATEYGVGVDLWSSGCILAELLAGRPIMPARTEVEQLHKIFKLCGSPSDEYWKKSKLPHATIFKPQQPYKRCIAETFKDFSPSSLDLLDNLLAIEPSERGTASQALRSEFFTTPPYACDPSSLPKYPPSKEWDAKMREEENRRQRDQRILRNDAAATAAAVNMKYQTNSMGKDCSISKAAPAPDANAELQASLQKKRQLQFHSSFQISRSEKFKPRIDDEDDAQRSQKALQKMEKPVVVAAAHQAHLPITALSHSGPLGFASATSMATMATAARKKKAGGDGACEDVRMAPSRPILHRSNISISVSQEGGMHSSILRAVEVQQKKEEEGGLLQVQYRNVMKHQEMIVGSDGRGNDRQRKMRWSQSFNENKGNDSSKQWRRDGSSVTGLR